MQDYSTYIDFVKYSTRSLPFGNPDKANGIDWGDFYHFCLRQGIAGIVFEGLERSGLQVTQKVLFEWIGTVEHIKKSNRVIDKRCHQISRFWEQQGYRSCILKGQANAMMYPRPELRSPGDIDIWVWKEDDERVAEIIRIAQREAPNGHYSLHHVTMPVFSDTSVEVHYRPVFLDNWWKDKRLQCYVDQVRKEQFNHQITLSDGKTAICRLTDDFNAVFLLLHMWHHLLSTRNNFKQLIDYYYLLKRGVSDVQRSQIGRLFNELGVLKYAQGIMWVEHNILGLEEQYLLVKPDEKIGQLLLNETLHYGEKRADGSKMKTLVGRVTNNLHLFWHFPSPVLIAPAYLVWHQWWKYKMHIKLKHHYNLIVR